MNFYKEWYNAVDTSFEGIYIKQYLDLSEESLYILNNGDKEDIIFAIKFLLNYPIEKLISYIYTDYDFTSKDIFQYSNLEDATTSICNALEISQRGMSFKELGQHLTGSLNDVACNKYGENHSKMAYEFSFVKFEKTDKQRNLHLVTNTSLGSMSTALSLEEKHRIIAKLCVRNPFVKSLIYHAKSGPIQYKDLASKVISESTLIRRKHNVEILVDMILNNNPILNNIRW